MDYTFRCKRVDGMSDRELVDAILNNKDDAAFCFFNSKCIKFFENISRKFHRLGYSGSDVASEMYIHLSNNDWKNLRSFEFRSSLFSWLQAVTNNFLLNKAKYMIDMIFFSCLIVYGEEIEYDPMENIPDPYQTILEEMIEDSDLIQELYNEIDSLDGNMREVARLRCVIGLSSKETAEILCRRGKNITHNAVDQLLKRAKDVIRKNMLGR